MSNTSQVAEVVLEKIPKVKPRELAFLTGYYLPKSETVGNVYQSAIAAGYRPSYARILTTTRTTPAWLKNAKQYLNRVEPAHIRLVLEDIMYHGKSDRDRLKAAELYGKDQGMFVDRSEQQINVSFTNSIPRPVAQLSQEPHDTPGETDTLEAKKK